MGAMLPSVGDLGTVLDIAGPTLTTDFVGGPTLHIGRAAKLVLFADVTFEAVGTPVDSIELRIVGRYDSSDTWRPIQSSLKSEDPESKKAEHTFARADGNRKEIIVTDSHRGFLEVRVEAKHSGGTAVATDTVIVNGRLG